MKFRGALFPVAVLAATARHAWAEGNFGDTSMGVRYGPTQSNPGSGPGGGEGARDVGKTIVNVGHCDTWDYRSNFFTVTSCSLAPSNSTI